MKTKVILLIIGVCTLLVFAFKDSILNGEDPWTQSQLMAPADLAKSINDPASRVPIIYNIGPAGHIKGCVDIGDTKESENLASLKSSLIKLKKDTGIVIYCGCCPYNHCPNIRPAFKLLNDLKFTNHKLLDLPKNLKVDWIDKGYPMKD